MSPTYPIRDYFRPAQIARLAIVMAMLVLTACGIAPGMHASEDNMPPVTLITSAVIAAERPPLDVDNDSLLSTFSQTSTHYRIGPADVLAIGVVDHPELMPPDALAGRDVRDLPFGFVVGASGAISYPYVGNLQVAGKTVEEVSTELAAKLGNYIRQPQITVRIAAYRSQRVYVDGAVGNTGTLNITDVPMTLATALGSAGGLRPDGDASQITITRAGRVYPVSLPALARAGHGPDDLYLRHQDRVRVAERNDNPVFVAGEVGQAKPVPMQDGSLSLGQALALAGSLNQSASKANGVYVVRMHEGESQPTVYRLDAQSPTGLALAAHFPLQPRDLVYVQASGLMRWNRVMSLLLSSTLSLYNTQRAAEGM